MQETDSQKYIEEITESIKPLNPIVIYIEQPNVKDAVDRVLDERGNEWLNAVMDYHFTAVLDLRRCQKMKLEE